MNPGSNWEVRRLAPALGAEVIGLDAARPLVEEEFERLYRAWLDADGVLVLRDQKLEPERHVAFSRRFGHLFGEAEPLQDTVKPYLHPDHPAIYRVSNKRVGDQALGRSRAGTYWHSDVSFRARPAKASLLYAIELPQLGGDTMFASMYGALESLSEGFRAMLSGLSAVHDFAAASPEGWSHERIVEGDLEGANRAVHPVVITHPDTGRRALFVNPGFTAALVDMTREESAAVLAHAYEQAVRPENVYRHRWRPGDLVIWDNRCVMHRAVSDYEGTGDRYLHRTTVIADAPVA